MADTQSRNRTIAKELLIAAAPERLYRAFTEQAELEAWFEQTADVGTVPGGVFNLFWGPGEDDRVAGTIVALDAPHRFAFDWDEGAQYGTTRCTVEFAPHAEGTLLRLTHTGFGTGELWDTLYDDVDTGWDEELGYLRRWVTDDVRKVAAAPDLQ